MPKVEIFSKYLFLMIIIPNRQSYNSWFKTPGLQDSGTPGLRDSQTLGLQDSRTLGLPNSKTPKHQDSRTPRLPDSHTESQCERLCIWGAPHIFQMKYFAIWVAKFRFWKLDRGQRLCWCAPGLWGWSVEEVHKFILVGRYWLISYLTCTTTSFNAINKHKYSHFTFGGRGGRCLRKSWNQSWTWSTPIGLLVLIND